MLKYVELRKLRDLVSKEIKENKKLTVGEKAEFKVLRENLIDEMSNLNQYMSRIMRTTLSNLKERK